MLEDSLIFQTLSRSESQSLFIAVGMADSLISNCRGYVALPETYVRPPAERPSLSDVVSGEFPLIDLGGSDRRTIVAQIAHACEFYGFFRVINHGVSEQSVRDMVAVTRDFFNQPAEEKMKFYSEDPLQTTRLSTSFNVRREKVRNWRDYLRLHCFPLEDFIHEWPESPPPFRDIVSKYCTEVRQFGLNLLELISESLNFEKYYLAKVLNDLGQHMAINYYPPCPEPELTYGLPAHRDPNVVTILLSDDKVAGLQVFQHEKWVAVDPYPNVLLVNLGDQMEALTNGKYKSVRHRAIVNSSKERISVATFFCPANEAIIGPIKELLNNEVKAIYKEFTYDEYYKKFWARCLDDQHCLDLFKI